MSDMPTIDDSLFDITPAFNSIKDVLANPDVSLQDLQLLEGRLIRMLNNDPKDLSEWLAIKEVSTLGRKFARARLRNHDSIRSVFTDMWNQLRVFSDIPDKILSINSEVAESPYGLFFANIGDLSMIPSFEFKPYRSSSEVTPKKKGREIAEENEEVIPETASAVIGKKKGREIYINDEKGILLEILEANGYPNRLRTLYYLIHELNHENTSSLSIRRSKNAQIGLIRDFFLFKVIKKGRNFTENVSLLEYDYAYSEMGELLDEIFADQAGFEVGFDIFFSGATVNRVKMGPNDYPNAAQLFSKYSMDRLVELEDIIAKIVATGLSSAYIAIAFRSTVITEFEESNPKPSSLNEFLTYSRVKSILENILEHRTKSIKTSVDELSEKYILKSRIRNMLIQLFARQCLARHFQRVKPDSNLFKIAEDIGTYSIEMGAICDTIYYAIRVSEDSYIALQIEVLNSSKKIRVTKNYFTHKNDNRVKSAVPSAYDNLVYEKIAALPEINAHKDFDIQYR